jgi:acyl-coenzyme A thioesterase PaaI-like protein
MNYDAIRDGMGMAVPFVRHAGVALREVGCGVATAVQSDTPELRNHMGTLHAGALYTLGETASGAAIAGALAPILADVRPLATAARIQYLRPARGEIIATATLADAELLQAQVVEKGRVSVQVLVSLRDSKDVEVGRLEVDWTVLGPRPKAGD